MCNTVTCVTHPKMKGSDCLVNYNISYSSNPPSKLYDVNNLEHTFFESLFSKFQEANLNGSLKMIRMSNGTLAIEYSGYPIGKVKLQGRIHTMQILKGLYTHSSVEGSIQDFIPKIDAWVKYAKRYIK